MRNTLYIHAGMPKTGSQTIMSFLHKNESLFFQKYNLYIPQCGRYESLKDRYIQHEIVRFFYGEATKLDTLLDELEQFPSANYLVSDQSISWVRLEKKHLDKFVGKFPNHTVKFILYVRRPDHFLRSRYITSCIATSMDWAKNDYQKTIEYLRTKSPQQVYPSRLIEEYQSLVGRENVIVKLFDKKRFVNKNIIDDFFECLDIKLPDNIDKKIHIANVAQTINHSLPYLALGLLPDRIRTEDARQLFRLTQKIFSIDHTLPDEAQFSDTLHSEIDKLEQYIPGYKDLFAEEKLDVHYPGDEVEPYKLLTVSLLYHVLHGQEQMRREIQELRSQLQPQSNQQGQVALPPVKQVNTSVDEKSEDTRRREEEFYSAWLKRLTPTQRAIYDDGIDVLEKNGRFMDYVRTVNTSAHDAIIDNMYAAINYKMCMARTANYCDLAGISKGKPGQVIFDIGCGSGYFSYLAGLYGHRVFSLDIEDVALSSPMFAKCQSIFKLDMIHHTIKAFQALPLLPEKASLVTAFSPHFYQPSSDAYWRVDAWRFFLRDLAKNMRPDAKIFFDLNEVKKAPEFFGFGSQETQDLFASLGARIKNYRVFFDSVEPLFNL